MGTAAVLPMVVSFLALTRIVAVKDNTYRSSLSCARRSHIGGTMMEARPVLHSPCQSTSTPYYYGIHLHSLLWFSLTGEACCLEYNVWKGRDDMLNLLHNPFVTCCRLCGNQQAQEVAASRQAASSLCRLGCGFQNTTLLRCF